jgi:hypothetical protein
MLRRRSLDAWHRSECRGWIDSRPSLARSGSPAWGGGDRRLTLMSHDRITRRSGKSGRLTSGAYQSAPEGVATARSARVGFGMCKKKAQTTADITHRKAKP